MIRRLLDGISHHEHQGAHSAPAASHLSRLRSGLGASREPSCNSLHARHRPIYHNTTRKCTTGRAGCHHDWSFEFTNRFCHSSGIIPNSSRPRVPSSTKITRLYFRAVTVHINPPQKLSCGEWTHSAACHGQVRHCHRCCALRPGRLRRSKLDRARRSLV
jgi:hypothetical protein